MPPRRKRADTVTWIKIPTPWGVAEAKGKDAAEAIKLMREIRKQLKESAKDATQRLVS